jgi:hypothetical protein
MRGPRLVLALLVIGTFISGCGSTSSGPGSQPPAVVSQSPIASELSAATPPAVVSQPPAASQPPIASQPPAATPPAVVSQPPIASQPPAATPPAVVSQPPAVTGPPASSPRGKGSISYQITGGYTLSGELPFAPSRGNYFNPSANGGWLVLFAEDPLSRTDYLWLRTRPSNEEIQFGKGGITVDAGIATSDKCTWKLTKNDASGLSGTVICKSAELWKDNGRFMTKISFRAQWDAQP